MRSRLEAMRRWRLRLASRCITEAPICTDGSLAPDRCAAEQAAEGEEDLGERDAQRQQLAAHTAVVRHRCGDRLRNAAALGAGEEAARDPGEQAETGGSDQQGKPRPLANQPGVGGDRQLGADRECDRDQPGEQRRAHQQQAHPPAPQRQPWQGVAAAATQQAGERAPARRGRSWGRRGGGIGGGVMGGRRLRGRSCGRCGFRGGRALFGAHRCLCRRAGACCGKRGQRNVCNGFSAMLHMRKPNDTATIRDVGRRDVFLTMMVCRNIVPVRFKWRKRNRK